ncbi:hypothetical protein H6F74_05670 [Trichocoleus sp. FACHB-90]|uniref:hypothetical protein n=1 Tax=Cyanophyceae TaxID=3028117 RepID=UPI00168539CE|nr:hypothetical protein [Trichocoleus sp. FACHB-90]MBD1925771.1 hypothetical protein [Trichocoleus sp. FACHB-90]
MSSFNPNKKQLPAQHWQEIAHDSVEETGSQYLIIGGIVGGLFAASITAFPPTGLLVAGWGFYEAWRKTAAANRNEQAISEYGCVAHVLKGNSLRQFANQVGTDEALQQITWAQENDYILTADAEDFLEAHKPIELPPIASDVSSNSNLVEQASAIFKPQPQELPLDSSHSPALTEVSLTTQTLPSFDRSRIINESKGLMIIGDSGTAKTCIAMYVANGFNGYGIIVFDPHGKTDWGNAYVITKMPAIYKQMRILLDVLDDGDESPFLVICDEWMEIRFDRLNKSGDYKGLADDFIRLFSTKPRKFNKLAVFVLHSPNVEAAGIDSSLRENYQKIYLGRLAKKEFSDIKDCAYPCVVEDEQVEHPTHGHHDIFRKNGNAPRSLQPLNSAAIDIPLAYIDRGEIKTHKQGWVDGSFAYQTNVRERLEFLLSDTSIDTGTDTGISEKDPKNSDTGTDTGIDTNDTEPDTSDTASSETLDNTGSSSDTRRDTPDTITPAQIPRSQALQLIKQMKGAGLSQTLIIQSLWGCEKNKVGWKQAYLQFKELAGGDDE